MSRSRRTPTLASVSVLTLVLGLPTGAFGQTAEVKEPAGVDEVTQSAHSLGNFIEVIVIDNDLNEFEGWIRSKARVEIFDPRRSRYLQLLDTPANRELDNAGLRVYYVDGMEGHIFIKYAQIDEIVTVRKISAEEERLWEDELERQLLERIEQLRKKAQLEAEQAAEEEGAPEEGMEGEAEEQVPEIPAELKRGYALMDEFPPPEWGDLVYKQLRRQQLRRKKGLTIDERRFLEEYIDNWKPAYEHKLAQEAKQQKKK